MVVNKKKLGGDGETESIAIVVFSVLFYMITAIVMVMVNKWVLNAIETPVAFLWVQLILAVLFLHIGAFVGLLTIPKKSIFDTSLMKSLSPLILVNVSGLTFNTLCLDLVDASFFQVARSLVLPFTVVLTYYVLKQKSSFLILLSTGIVFLGFLAGTIFDFSKLSAMGVFFGIISSITTALHAIVIKKSMEVVKGNTMDLVYLNNVWSAMALLPVLFLAGEYGAVKTLILKESEDTFDSSLSPFWTFITGALITGFFGFLINIAGFLQIKVTSPTSHMVSSAVRGVLQTFVAMFCFGDIITVNRWAGIILILFGSCLYTYIRSREAAIHNRSYTQVKRTNSDERIQATAKV